MAPSEPVRETFQVRAMRVGARNIHLFELYPENGAALPEVAPGSHIDLVLPDGQIRQYSLITPLCSSKRYVIGVKKEAAGRGGSRWLHDDLRLGQSLAVGGCRNSFPLDEFDVPYTLFAGGIGITPIYSMYRELKRLGKKVHLHYWGESIDSMLFHDELAAEPGVTLYPKQDSAARPRLKEVVQSLETGSCVYCCGPGQMIEELVESTEACGLTRVYYEYFGKAPVADGDGEALQIVLAKSGQVIEVAGDESILDALIRNDVDVMYSCEQGICGACETRVLEGSPVHLDSVKDVAEHNSDRTMMICCSRAGTERLVLDL
ncbi:oxidoreductase [Marinobacter salinexigens]|uniref:Oxidoreductase n=1 Tax=Marinobacter salinexigens TaxID=2919747 RepID=A0A5B0VDT8_9GAMM|nr:PDR/VanB family oxidoreductase [Marinobacter salinexigens]KAA1172876.1 oxidoreductase [Marinobacter salinexigens]